ncbi:hypothetical protein ACS0TY_011241 [Phlomoides rotata]
MGASNYDEILMHCSLQFAESLKDLKNVREQLYSAAEYFESSYEKSDHQQLVVESSKEYVTKALVSSVDHLGSVADKLNKFLDKKANEFSATNIRFSCLQQRLRTLQGSRGVSQEWLIIEAPQHNKRYNFQVKLISMGRQSIFPSCRSAATTTIIKAWIVSKSPHASHVQERNREAFSFTTWFPRIPCYC